MSDAIEKIEKYLSETEYRGEYDEGEYDEEVDDFEEFDLNNDIDLMDKMVEFLMTINPDILDDEQFEMYSEIMDDFDGDEEEIEDFDGDGEVDEAIRVKRDKAARRASRKEYRKKKVALAQKGKRWRKTAEYKKYQRKKKMMAKQGRTARGKKVKKFVE